MSLRWKRNQRLKCVCGGYHFPHRIGGGACDHSKTREYHLAKRGGDANDIAEARMNCAVKSGVATLICPF